jgi:ankyrin repeat protein
MLQALFSAFNICGELAIEEALSEAAHHNNPEMVRFLIDKHASMTCGWRMSVLQAIENALSNATAVGADVNTPEKRQVMENCLDILEQLLAPKTFFSPFRKISEENKIRLLQQAVDSSSTEVLQVLKAYLGISKNNLGLAAIKAAKANNLALVRILLDHGVITWRHTQMAIYTTTDQNVKNYFTMRNEQKSNCIIA